MTSTAHDNDRVFAPEHYDEALGSYYPQLFSPTSRDLERLYELLPPPPANGLGTVLDLGCGQGRHFPVYARAGYSHIIGIEVSARLADDARARSAALGLDAVVTCADLFNLQSTPGSDLVVIAGMTFTMFSEPRRQELLHVAAAAVRNESSAVVIEFADIDRVRAFVQTSPSWSYSLEDGGVVTSAQELVGRTWYQTHSFPDSSHTSTEVHHPASFDAIDLEARTAGFEVDFVTRRRYGDGPEGICQVAVLSPSRRSLR